jgi:uncharacterized SAM-binding protein YcdF (DUF218 family)
LEDIKNAGPDIYWNATDWGNDNLRQRVEEGFLEQYGFPKEKLIISPNLGIRHTGHQFEKMEDNMIEGKRKIVIISDAYHIPRVKRYLNKKGNKINKENSVLYPTKSKRFPIDKTLGEINKIPDYIERGILPKEE